MIYDAAIIGTGPAGLSAALNLKIRGRNFLWIGSRSLSDRMARAEKVLNYPGFIGVSGAALAQAFRAQAEAMDLRITEAMVSRILPMEDRYALMAGADFYEAKTVLLATGIAPRGALPGESERVGLGVSYCATCDGGLYRGRSIAVICTNPRFMHEVKFLAGLAERVWFFPDWKAPDVPGPNVIVPSARPVAIEGGQPLTVRLSDGDAVSVDGVFCLRDSIEPNTLLPGLALRDGHIAVDRDMAASMPGCFAAGDCTGRPYQFAKAVGEGNVAAHSILETLKE